MVALGHLVAAVVDLGASVVEKAADSAAALEEDFLQD